MILITGACGRIGMNAAKLFSKQYPVVGFDVFIPKEKIPNVEFFIVDLSSDQSVQEGFAKVKARFGNHIVSIIHLAAYYNFAGGHWDQYETITINGTRRILESARSFEVEQFIFSSTMLIYKPSVPGKKIHLNSPIEPKWEYPLSKVKTEQMIHEKRGSIPTVILRIAGVYDDDCHSIPISQQIQRIYEKQLESHLFSGDLSHGAAYVHMHDLIDALALCVEKRKTLPKESVFIISEAETLSYKEMQNQIGQLLFGKPWKTWSVPKWFAKLGAWAQNLLPFKKKSFIKPWMIDIADDHYEMDISDAEKGLGWRPQRSVRGTLPKIIQRLKSDPAQFYRDNNLQ
ncbi:MAG TPA: NAD(P)-dependent oxidoreductase [Rhabdochlamydiaceae bacterium]|nr:NAD(P)-dependent oxidoreductase [Rhabdochlamydiaceae bacterium]